jgi:hypothetical protein
MYIKISVQNPTLVTIYITSKDKGPTQFNQIFHRNHIYHMKIAGAFFMQCETTSNSRVIKLALDMLDAPGLLSKWELGSFLPKGHVLLMS